MTTRTEFGRSYWLRNPAKAAIKIEWLAEYVRKLEAVYDAACGLRVHPVPVEAGPEVNAVADAIEEAVDAIVMEERTAAMTHDEYLRQPHLDPNTGDIPLPNGCTLFWKNGEQGREYHSDEIGGGVLVWHTALVDDATLLAALTQEASLRKAERERSGTNDNS
jgi:hypothetical protein